MIHDFASIGSQWISQSVFCVCKCSCILLLHSVAKGVNALNFLDYVIRLDSIILSAAAEWLGKCLKSRIEKLENDASERAESLKAAIKSAHKSMITVEASVIAFVPALLLLVLTGLTVCLYFSEGPWAAWHRFGVVWIIFSIFLFLLDYKNDLFRSFTGSAHRLFDLLPQDCKWEGAEEEYERRGALFLKVRRFIELSMAGIGTFLTGYGDLVEAWLHSWFV
jgi:hypothetical protein